MYSQWIQNHLDFILCCVKPKIQLNFKFWRNIFDICNGQNLNIWIPQPTFSLLFLTGHSKIKFFCRVSPIQYRTFCYVTCTFKRTSLRLFRFKISQFVPFLHICYRFWGFLIQNGTNDETWNLNNRRLVCFVHVMYITIQVLFWWGNPTKKYNFWVNILYLFSGGPEDLSQKQIRFQCV